MRHPATALLVALLGANVAYVGGYVLARATHRLVRYDDFIARPNVLSGIGPSAYEIAFAPLVWAEETVRRRPSR